VDFIVGNHKIDIKTTYRTVDPRDFYNCYVDVGVYESNNEANVYAFCSINSTTKKLFILGFLKKEDFDKKKKLIKAGESIGPKNIAKTVPMYSVLVSDLESIDNLKICQYQR